ncbi:MAG: hypothetical protein HYR70_03125 [Chloroflexi bacterium]|nr:hypothetical protein [Chloroflexota bacterium]MBI3340002.1 hypothetical protein [Chloroflexota bacterium]
MKTIRRLYFYAVALISLEVVLWGLISLIRSILDETVGGGAETLSQALALILVGVPIFLFHWLMAQRFSAQDEEEKVSSLRAIFLYAVLLGTLIPLVQNLLALIDRSFIQTVRMAAERAIIGGSQTWPDNVIAILMNGLVAVYFWNILRGEWKTLPSKENFTDVRRLYRYLWTLYSLLMVIFGAEQVIRFLFYVPSNVLGGIGRETLVNGLSLLVVGTPIWFYSWRIIQDSLADAAEKDSNLRLGILYILALSGVITVLTTSAMLVNIIVTKLLGADMTNVDFIQQIGGVISIGVPLGAVWAYYGYWLTRHIASIGDVVRQAGMKRVYFYILSALGLGGAFIGVFTLIKFTINFLTGGQSLFSTEYMRGDLARAISLLVAWLPLWLMTWRPMQAESFAKDETGDHARQSIIRRVYLYLALFAGVIGGMASAVALVFQLIRILLSGQIENTFLSSVLNDFQLLILFVVLLIYHLAVLRRDSLSTADALSAKQSQFKVLVVDSGENFGESILAALAKFAPSVPVTMTSAAEKPSGKFDALILSGSLAVNTPDWFGSFKGNRIIVPNEAAGLIWAGGINRQSVQQAAQLIRQLAEGQEIHQQTSGSSAWMIIIYIGAALFGLELLFLLLALGISLIAG